MTAKLSQEAKLLIAKLRGMRFSPYQTLDEYFIYSDRVKKMSQALREAWGDPTIRSEMTTLHGQLSDVWYARQKETE